MAATLFNGDSAWPISATGSSNATSDCGSACDVPVRDIEELLQQGVSIRTDAPGCRIFPAAAYQATVAASNTGPSTQTRFMAGPSGVLILTVQPAQPPTAQAMYSSSDTWQGSS